jgi:hypothetical protein
LKKRPFLVGAIAVDGKNCRGADLNGLDHVIFWTKFAEDEARKPVDLPSRRASCRSGWT